MINRAVPVVPVSKLDVIEDLLKQVGIEMEWSHEPVPGGPKYASFTNAEKTIELHASESRGDGSGPVVVYFRVDDIDALAAKAGVEAHDQTWHTREFWLKDTDGNSYRFGQAI